jgi:hypothetical protein
MGGHDTYDSAGASHRALRGIQRELDRHPLVETVRGFPAGEYTQVVAELSTTRLDITSSDPTLTVRWFAGDTSDSGPEFSFHYSDSRGDFGWHHEPNPHVDGWGHFQERTGAETEYTYEPQTFTAENPTRLVWEIMAAVSTKLE